MAGFFILLLFIILAKYWYVLAGVVGLWLLWCMVLDPARQREIEQTRLRLQHERTRAEIDAAARTATQAMIDATAEWRP
jgi:hypothetical protein